MRVVRRTGRGGGGGQFIKISVGAPSLRRIGLRHSDAACIDLHVLASLFSTVAGAAGELEHDEAASQEAHEEWARTADGPNQRQTSGGHAGEKGGLTPRKKSVECAWCWVGCCDLLEAIALRLIF
jgi:hypothetical protein